MSNFTLISCQRLPTSLLSYVCLVWRAFQPTRDSMRCTLLVSSTDEQTSTPCLSEGRSAHWGVVRGFAVQSHDAHLQFVRQKDAAEGEEPGEDVKQSREFQYDSSKMVLLVSHGVSARPFACSYEELRASNVQLDDWVPTGEDVVRFVLPTREMQDMGSDGGGGGFRSQLAGTFIAPALPCPAAVGSWRPFDLFPV
mmetsp:Transcript_15493/g.27482  ORF Transcript_15493/g.27482 Transcript_15493/m.27482 type:complete len:196 (+) Transcript_15493:652-1239(+)